LTTAPLYRPLDWDIDFLASNETVRSKRFGIPREAKAVRYPIRLLRYWFGYHLLRVEAERLGRPLDVAEVGVHSGQFLEFVRSAPVQPAIGQWTAVDAVVLAEKLRKAGYSEWIQGNVEDEAFTLPGEYHAAVLLHILEHLFEPEAALRRVAAGLRPGGVIIGGFPVLPDVLVARRQKSVRRTAKPMGHVSVFSPERVVRMGRAAGCETEFLSGAFFMRSKGSRLENSAAWMRFNLWWGRRFPWWPGEVYWLMRKGAPR
jgi:SAM-dependent methyltransferase